jgi:hypothetical protein
LSQKQNNTKIFSDLIITVEDRKQHTWHNRITETVTSSPREAERNIWKEKAKKGGRRHKGATQIGQWGAFDCGHRS